ncbi:MAG: hypothetical protein V7641_4389 [Blastocatellia bacterium]
MVAKRQELNNTGSFFLPPDQRRILQSIAQLAHCLTNMPVAIWLLDSPNQSLHIYAGDGLTDDYVSRASARLGDGSVVSQVIDTGAAQVIQHTDRDSRFRYADQARQAGWLSGYHFPITFREQTCGVIEAFACQRQPIGDDKFDHFHRFADIARLAVESTYHSLGSQKLAEIARDLSAIPDFGRAMQVLVESARQLTGADSGTIILLDKQSDSFAIGARAPMREDIPIRLPRTEGGLTRTIITESKTVKVNDTTQDKRIREDVLKEGVRSLIGVRVQMEEERIGVLYVNGHRKAQFTEYDVHLLEQLANYASVALSWARLLLEPSVQMEGAIKSLFNLDEVLNGVCKTLQESQHFDGIAVQLTRPAERIIETLQGTGFAGQWGGLAWKHYLEKRKSLRDIQTDIALSSPPRIELIAGWDERFDQWIYETFHHEQLVRIFAPLVVMRNYSGKPTDDWFERCQWNVIPGKKKRGGHSIALEMALPDAGENTIEVIGTIEASYVNQAVDQKRGSRQDQAEAFAAKAEDLIEPAKRLFKLGAQQALDIWRARLPHVLQTVAECAMRILGADSASTHFAYDSQRHRYIYEVSCGQIGQRFLKDHTPRREGLGQQAVRERKPKFIPDFSQNHGVLELERLNPRLFEKGIKAIAAFPLLVGQNHGVLYIHFQHQHHFTQDEIGWVQLFVNWAVDAIGHYTTYRQMRDRARQLASLHSIVQSLVSKPDEEELLRHVAWNTLNTLGADIVTIYEYIEPNKRFVTPPAIAGRLKQHEQMHTKIREHDAPALLVKHGDHIYLPHPAKDPIFNKAARSKSAHRRPSFVIREMIKSTAGILLKVGEETVGVMFINYRRPHAFPDEERNTIEILASAAAIAIKNRRLMDTRGEGLSTGAREIITTLDLPQVLNLVVRRAVNITGADVGVISLYDPLAQELVLQTSYPDHPPNEPVWTRIKMGKGITGWVAKHGDSALVPDLRADKRHKPYFQHDGSALCVPLQDKDGHILGVLGMKSRQLSKFNRIDQRTLEVFSNYAVIAIQNAENQRKLSASNNIAMLDGLASQLLHWISDEIGLIRLDAQAIEQGDSLDPRSAKTAVKIRFKADRIIQETGRIKDWFRGKTPQQLIRIQKILAEARSRVDIPVNIKVKVLLADKTLKVRGSVPQLIHVFVNLIQNAIDALPQGGALAISSESLSLKDKPWTIIRVKDSGMGIKTEHLEKIFQPGYSTKEGRGNMGFGLWWTRAYIELLGGEIRVESLPEKGTEFTVVLPAY